MIKIEVINNITPALQRAEKELMEVGRLSVEEAARLCWTKWKQKIPVSTGKSWTNLYYTPAKTDDKGSSSMVVSPANIKPYGFLLNLFLEKASAPGYTTTNIKGKKSYTLRNGKIFGAGQVSLEETKPYFIGKIKTLMDTKLKVFNN